MSDAHEHDHAHPHEDEAPRPVFRFGAFADAPSAQAAFDALYPPGSPLGPVLQALVDMGAQCRALGSGAIACRYVESPDALAGWCWHVVLETAADKTLGRGSIALAALGM